MNRLLGSFIGSALLAYLAWDSSVYFLGYTPPFEAFRWAVLPVALGFYAVFGVLFLSGYLQVSRRRGEK